MEYLFSLRQTRLCMFVELVTNVLKYGPREAPVSRLLKTEEGPGCLGTEVIRRETSFTPFVS